jgi:hypothetical protein
MYFSTYSAFLWVHTVLPGTPVSSTNKTDRQDITKILLITITLTLYEFSLAIHEIYFVIPWSPKHIILYQIHLAMNRVHTRISGEIRPQRPPLTRKKKQYMKYKRDWWPVNSCNLYYFLNVYSSRRWWWQVDKRSVCRSSVLPYTKYILSFLDHLNKQLKRLSEFVCCQQVGFMQCSIVPQVNI